MILHDKLLKNGKVISLLEQLLNDNCVYCDCDMTNKDSHEGFCDIVCQPCGDKMLAKWG